MRGRVDVSEGFPRPAPHASSVNLIQEADYGIGLSKLLRVQERSPAPTVADQIQPVFIVDDQRYSGFPVRDRIMGGRAQLGDGVSRAWVGINCRGKVPSGNPYDKLVVHRVIVSHTSFAILGIEAGRNAGIAGLGGAFCAKCNTTRDAPNTGAQRSDFAGLLFGLSGDAPDPNNGHQFMAGINPVTLEGPWILNQLEALVIYQFTASVNTLSAIFFADEYPAP